MYEVATSCELVGAGYDNILPNIKVLPKGTCCCLQSCNFDVSFMLTNKVCVQSFNFV